MLMAVSNDLGIFFLLGYIELSVQAHTFITEYGNFLTSYILLPPPLN